MASPLREILAKFGVSFDDAELKKGLESVKGGIKLLKGFAGALGIGLSLGALKDFVIGVTEQVVALDKQARYLRVGVEELQRWQQAAQIAGASNEALTGALEQMRLRSRKPTEALLKIADRLAAIKNPTRRAMIGTAMLGNSYRELEPLLEKGSKGIRKLLGDTEDLAVVFGRDSVIAAKENRANLARLSIVWNGLITQIGALLLPVLAQLTKALVPIAVGLKNITKHTHLFRAAAIVLSTGGLFMLVRRFGSLTGVLKAALPILRAFSKQLLTTALSAARIVLPLLILEDFFVFLAGGKSAFGEAIDKAFGEGSQQKVRSFINVLFSDWDSFKEYWGALWDYGTAIMEIFIHESILGFVGLGALIEDAFGVVWNGIVDGAKWTIRQLAAGIKALGLSDAATSLEDFERSMDQSKISTDNVDKARAWNDQMQESIGKDLLKASDTVSRMSEQLAAGQKLGAGSESSPGKSVGRPSKRTAEGESPRFNRVKKLDRPTPANAQSGKPAGPANVTVNNNTQVNATVAPGTPKQVANRIANTTAKSLHKNNQATYAAVVPGRG